VTPNAVNDWKREFSFCEIFCKSFVLLQLQRKTTKISKGKGNVDLYSASLRTPLTRSDMVNMVLPANNTIYAFTRKHSLGGATMHSELTTHLSTTRG